MRSPVGVVRLERVAAAQPSIVSRDLALQAATEVPPFKRRVRQELGLTESVEVGYRPSPRGAPCSTGC